MEESKDIRWVNRLDVYSAALRRLREMVEIANKGGELSPLLQGSIKELTVHRFEYTFEMARQVMKDYLVAKGVGKVYGAKSTVRRALDYGLITDREWLSAVRDRKLMMSDYDAVDEVRVYGDVVGVYFALFEELEDKLNKLKNK